MAFIYISMSPLPIKQPEQLPLTFTEFTNACSFTLYRLLIILSNQNSTNTVHQSTHHHKKVEHMTSVVPVAVGDEAFYSSSPCTSIPPPGSYKYDVFLSFRGEDTRKGFTGHLCAALEKKGITAFRDDKDLKRGEVISDKLLKAIEGSMIFVTILSPNYASSTWCLYELQHIVAWTKKRGLSIMPIFYDVEPSDVRHQKGSFEKAFIEHGKRFEQDGENVRRWRDALTQVSGIAGWHSKDEDEAKLVECIAEDIREKIQKLPPFTKNPVVHQKKKNPVGIASKTVERIGNVVSIKGTWKVSSKDRKVSRPEVEVELNSKNKIGAIFRGDWIK